MEVVCRGPFRARAFVWQPRQGAFALTVVCKATFVLTPGESPFHVEPRDVQESDVHDDDDPRRSLLSASDFAPLKKHAELLVVGHACAPHGRPVSSLVARVAFGDIDKSIAVFGDSHIALDNSFSSPVPFTRMPLRWERASAGIDGRNPVGVRMGRDARTDAWGRVALPNLRPIGSFQAVSGEAQPASLSQDGHPPPRLASRWEVLAPAGLGPIAPDWPSRAGRLGRAAPGSAAALAAPRGPLPPDLDTAFFNAAPEGQTAGDFFGDEELSLENLLPAFPHFTTRFTRLLPRAHAELAGGGRAAFELRCDTLVVDTDGGLATLVWRGHTALDHPERAAQIVVTGQALTHVLAEPVAPPVTPPFAPPSAPSAPSSSSPSSLPPEPTPRRPVLAPMAAAPSMKETVGLAGAIEGFVLPFKAKGTPPPPSGAPESHEDAETLRPQRHDDEESEPVFQDVYQRTADLAAWMRADAGADPLPFRAPHKLPLDIVAPAGEGVPSEPPPSPAVYPVDVCGGIAGQLACRPAEKAAVLEAHQLSEAGWESLAAHWAAELRKEAIRGKQALLAAYDAAHVQAIEAERGPISARDYADLVVAAERGALPAWLDTMSLPRGSFPHIRRVWLRRTVSDSALAKAVRAALAIAADAP